MPKPDDKQTSILDILKQAKSADLSPEDLATIERLYQVFKAREEDEEARKQRRREEREQRAREREKREAEHIAEVTSMDLPLDWTNAFGADPRACGVHAESIPDGLILSLTTLGRVDIEYIAEITGTDLKTVIETLRGAIYQNPETWGECFYRGWETAEEYLSGNLIRKKRAAAAANETYRGYFQANLEALDRVLPPAVTANDIYVTLGSPWVPTDVIDDFITHILLLRRPYRGTMHDEKSGVWELSNKSSFQSVRALSTYGTLRCPALHLLEKTLNMKSASVKDTYASILSKTGHKQVLNAAETVAAVEKQRKLVEEFQSWVWQDDARRQRLESIYEERFGGVRKRRFDGSFLTFPTMSPDISLYPYQKDAVARILFTPNTLLAHDVGAGKTYVMIAAGMELLRMGLSQKNVYVIPNNLVGQWEEIFLRMYPHAKLLVVDPAHFKPDRRAAMLEKMRDGKYDGILIAYSCFEQIPLSRAYYIQLYKERIAELDEAIKSGKYLARTDKKRKSLFSALEELLHYSDAIESPVCFDELGVTRLFVDEAHNFKNVPVETQADSVLGISKTGSKKCKDMMEKVHLVQRQNGGKGVVLATGTPITNSLTDAFIMQTYLQSGELAMLELQSFDSWVGMFAERATEFEIDVDTSGYRLVTRFSKFHNLPELTELLASVADFHAADSAAGMPIFDGYRDAVISRTEEFARYLKTITVRADRVRAGSVARKDDNMLKITTDGRKAALDFRLVEPRAGFTYQSKVARCAENVYSIYSRTERSRSTQLVFCDISTPKAGFNIYDELKRLLVSYGVPEEEIAYIHEAESESARSSLFERMRKGDIRVLIGSTFKLGLGVNVQDRLIALHHLDVPWRPADMTQREGRILRQGNMNGRIYIYRYVMEGSFDAYSWQILETKARFIADLLSGSVTDRSGSDVDETVLSYAEVKALAIGNPLVKQRVEAANELTRLVTLQRRAVENRLHLEQELAELPGRLKRQQELIDSCDADRIFAETQGEKRDREDSEARRILRERIGLALAENGLSPTEKVLGSYRGFDLVLPANMRSDRPYLILARQGRYFVDCGSNDIGNLVRIDNCIDTLGELLAKYRDGATQLRRRRKELKEELARDEGYSDLIERQKALIADIDKKLGVDDK